MAMACLPDTAISHDPGPMPRDRTQCSCELEWLRAILAFFITPLVALFDPYVQQFSQWLTSSALKRKIINVFVGLFVLLLIVGVSVVAYLSFYWVYIPQRGHVGQIHLQYDKPTVPGVIGHGPSAEFLRADQAYDISVNLHLPTSERNVEIGNFMVVVTLLRADGQTVMTSSRPAILTYQSLPVKLMRTAWKAVPLVLDWSKEVQVLKVPLVENFVEDAANPVTRAYIEISTPYLQVYFMYYYKVSTALVFISVFIFWEIVFSVVTWQMLAGWFGSEAEALAIAHQARTQTGEGAQQGMPSKQQLRSPTTYASSSSAPRGQLPAVGPSPRQPQLQEQRHGLEYNDSDSEFEEDRDLLAGSRRQGDAAFDHDEMEDDEDGQDQVPSEHVTRGPSSAFRDEAVVPERPITPSQRRHVAPGTSALVSGSRSATPTKNQLPLQAQQLRGVFVETDDGASTSSTTTTTTTSRRAGRGTRDGLDMSAAPSPGLHPPPPPPPSVLSERSTDFAMSQTGAGVGGDSRRTAVESEYTEEDDEYLEGVDDDDDDDDGDVTFGEDDFSEAALLSRSPTASRSVRSRNTPGSRSRDGARSGAGGSSGRSTGRAAI
ncbi:hypothetical protein BGZ98_008349 [Dissophora globulifera]|nr:hypothetical protein BGZ98_008349 [Dissophora globulifera]